MALYPPDATWRSRPDFTIEDVPMLMCGLSSTMAGRSPHGAFDWRRHLELILDAVRAR